MLFEDVPLDYIFDYLTEINILGKFGVLLHFLSIYPLFISAFLIDDVLVLTCIYFLSMCFSVMCFAQI